MYYTYTLYVYIVHTVFKLQHPKDPTVHYFRYFRHIHLLRSPLPLSLRGIHLHTQTPLLLLRILIIILIILKSQRLSIFTT